LNTLAVNTKMIGFNLILGCVTISGVNMMVNHYFMQILELLLLHSKCPCKFCSVDTQIQMKLGQFPQIIYWVARVLLQVLHPREYAQL
jgi:uncharacterized membrane protein